MAEQKKFTEQELDRQEQALNQRFSQQAEKRKKEWEKLERDTLPSAHLQLFQQGIVWGYRRASSLPEEPSSQVKPSTPAKSHLPASLPDNEYNALRCLYQQRPHGILIADLAADTKMSVKRCERTLRNLIQMGLAVRHGDRQGVGISRDGVSFLNEVSG
jgi:hypothetical protein